MDNKSGANEYFDSLVGKEINNTYKINRKIGVGGMGAVFEATNTRDNGRVAVKVISPHLASNSRFVKRFQREAKVGWVLSHPNIIKVHEFGETEDKLLFMAMEFVEGETLKAVLAKSPSMPFERCMELLRPLCEALEAAHKRKILHRDLKPENILITKDANGRETVKLADFGLVKLMQPDSEITKGSNLTEVGEVFGTPHYMAPEQVLGQPVTASADIYSLGVMAYQMITGKLPVEGSEVRQLLIAKVSHDPVPPSQKVPSVPKGFDPIFKKVLARHSDERYQKVSDFFRDLQQTIIRLSEAGELKISEEALEIVSKEYVEPTPSSGSVSKPSLTGITSTSLGSATSPTLASINEQPVNNKTGNHNTLILAAIFGVIIVVIVAIYLFA
ncbi:MAG: serine/threonine protein kinase [Blastocatellia bacterium]|nr:serine/threonine protein kinase [Blastocatellia bacterium]